MSPLTGGNTNIGPLSNNPLSNLNSALTANNQAYGGATNAAQQQYQQNAGAVNQNLINSGLGNTTVAQTMQQAPLQTYNNSLLNILGQKQAGAANIYGQAANTALNQTNTATQAGLQQAAMVPSGGVGQMGGLPTIQEGAQAPAATASALGGLVNLSNAMNSPVASAPYTPSQADIDEDASQEGF